MLTAQEDNALFNYIAKDMIEKVFPDLRKEKYTTVDNYLTNDVEKTIKKEQLGEVLLHMTSYETEDQVILHQQYSEEDFQSFKYSLGGPMP